MYIAITMKNGVITGFNEEGFAQGVVFTLHPLCIVLLMN